LWVKVWADVRALGGQPHDDYFSEVAALSLPVCYTRSDIPMPCVDEHDVPNNVANW